MPNPHVIKELQRQLRKLGCAGEDLRRIVQETADHHEDLYQAALRQGLPPDNAAKQAEAQLGDPVKLAEEHIVVLEKSSFRKNRFFFVGFILLGCGVLPLVFAVGCPFLTFIPALLGFELVRRSTKSAKWILLACAVTSLEALLIPTMAANVLNVLTPWLVAHLFYARKNRPSRRHLTTHPDTVLSD